MGSTDGVTVYQTDVGKCACSGSRDECFSPVDPVEIANNLLLDKQDSRKLRIVSPREFKPWYDSKKIVSLTFKFQPPTLSLSSVWKSNPSLDEKAQTVPSVSGHLLEFSPVYSGKSCIKPQPKKCSCDQSDSKSQGVCAEDNGLPIQSNRWSTLANAGDDSSVRNKLPQEVLNPLAKSLWCASPYISGNNRKEKGLVLEKFKDTNLRQVREKQRLNYHQRGKWIICRRKDSIKGKNLTIEQLWKKVHSLIKEGHLPHCNAKLQKTQDEVWVYCDFGHSLKVRSSLEKALGNVGAFSYCVHPEGVVMEL